MKKISVLLFVILSFISSSYAQSSRGAEAENQTESGFKEFKNVYGLIIGVSDYKEVPQLKYADNDADLICKVIETSFPQSKNKLIKLTNEKANEFNILSGFSSITKNAQAGDLVIFYFAGHGDAQNLESAPKGYLLAYDASKSKEYDLGGAVSFDRIYDSITKVAARKADVYLITDACHSGTMRNARGSSITNEGFSFLQNATSKFISCGKQEASLELDSLQHGAFTYFLVKSITGDADLEGDKILTVDEMQSYLKKNVVKATGNRQTPRIEVPEDSDVLFKCAPELSAYLSPDMLNNDLALRGSASVKSSNLIKFENAILNGDLHGKSTSATFLLENWTKTKGSPQGELEQMKQLLVESLLDRAQEDMNRFLRGKPTIGETEDYSGTVKDLRKAAELLGYSHFMTKTLENRANFFEAMEIIRKGEINSYPKAESILISLEKAEPKSAFVQQGLAMLYVAKNNRDAAQATLMKAEQRIASWDKPLNTGAQLNIVAGKLDISLKQLSKAEELGSDKSDIYLLRSQMHLANFELREAEKTLQLLKNGSPGSYQTERALILGKIEELRGRISNAEKVYRDELGNKEINTAILLKLADLYRTQKDTLRSKEFYSKVLRVEPENVIAKGAMLAFGSGATSGLTINFYDPEEVVAHLNTLERTKKNEEALTVINKALEINNWNPEYYYQKGKFLYNLNRKTESVEALKKGISLSPYHFESLRAIVLILLEQKKNTEADAILKQHDKYFQNSAKWLLFEYNAYRQMNSKMDLLTILEKAIKMDSFDLEPYRALIMFHTENNEYKYAQKELLNLMAFGGIALDEELFLIRIDKQVKSEFAARDYFPLYDGIEILLKEDPLNLDYHYMGGMVAYMNMDYSKAELHLKELAKFQQTLSPAALLEYYKLKGKVLLETGKFEDAERVFQMYNQKAGNPSYLGLAMAQYELGKRESWIPNFQKDRDTTDFNDTAMKRIAKMAVKANK